MLRDVAARLGDDPAAKFVDYEVPNGSNMPAQIWFAALTEWLAAYKAETGTPLDVMVLDMQWHLPWQATARQTINILHNKGTLAGVFLEAETHPGTTDASWVADAKKNAEAVNAAKLPFDIVLFATWMQHPRHNLPESDPTSFASMVDWYANTFHWLKQ